MIRRVPSDLLAAGLLVLLAVLFFVPVLVRPLSAVVGSVECGRDNCLAECLSDDEVACFRCTCGDNLTNVNCVQPFEACSGLSTTTCDMFGG